MNQNSEEYFFCDKLTICFICSFCVLSIFKRNISLAVMNENFLSSIASKFANIKKLNLKFNDINQKFELDQNAFKTYQRAIKRISDDFVNPFASKVSLELFLILPISSPA